MTEFETASTTTPNELVAQKDILWMARRAKIPGSVGRAILDGLIIQPEVEMAAPKLKHVPGRGSSWQKSPSCAHDSRCVNVVPKALEVPKAPGPEVETEKPTPNN